MKQINLVPDRIFQRAQRQRLVSATVVALLIGAAGGWGTQFVAQQLSAATEAQQEELKVAIQKAKLDQQKAEEEAGITPELISRVQLINAIQKNEIDWFRAYTLLNDLIPNDVRLESAVLMESDDPETSGGFVYRLTGDAPNLTVFNTFVARTRTLEADKVISSLAVDGIQYDAENGTVVFSATVLVPTAAIDFTLDDESQS